MRYVTNYISKFKDPQSTESLYSTFLVPAAAAYHHLRDMKPCEPEMVMTLSSFKMAWSNNGTKSYVPPRPSSAETNVLLMRYYRRNDEENVSLLEFLRTHDTSKASCPFYKHQKCLVGIKYVSYFNPDFFFQFLLINHPHRNLDDLKHPNHETLPHDLTYFASCLVNIPHLLSEEFIREMLQKEGHKSYFIDNVVNFIDNTRNVYQLWQIQILRNDDFLSLQTESQHDSLDPMQRAVLDTLKSFLRLQSRYYNFRTSCIDDSAVADTSIDSGNDWTKILSVTGKAGTGKTKCLHSCIRYIIEKELTCLVATPTGYLASSYRAIFDEDIDANTIHSSFCIPIDRSSPQVNWALGTYDLIIIDEISMVSLSHFNHIFSSLKQLATRPILLICGDRYQLPPITTVNNQTTNTTSVYDLESLPRICRSFNLTRQHRCVDEQYSDILNHLRCWKPTVDMLDKLHEGRLLHHSQSINDTDLLSIIRDNASSTFVTISRNAVTRINMLVLKNLFTANLHVGTVQMDNDNPMHLPTFSKACVSF